MPPEPNSAKAALTQLTKALRRLHKTLVDATRDEYERQYGPIADAGQLLQLLTKHPQFDWLHQLSEFMVDVDELLDEEQISQADLRSAFTEAKSLVAPSPEAELSDFSRHYIALLPNHPAVVMAHADVRRLLT